MIRLNLESFDVCAAAVLITGMVVGALCLRAAWRTLDAIGAPPPPPLPPPSPSCPICGEPMERVAALFVDDAVRFAARGLPAPDYVCSDPECCYGPDDDIVYCYAVRPGEPVQLRPPKPAPEGDLA